MVDNNNRSQDIIIDLQVSDACQREILLGSVYKKANFNKMIIPFFLTG